MVDIIKGSEKQIAWAEKIRESEMNQLDHFIFDAQGERDFAIELNDKEGEIEARNTNIQHQNERIAYFNYMKDQLGKIDDAQRWIKEARGIAQRGHLSNNGIRNGKIVKLG